MMNTRHSHFDDFNAPPETSIVAYSPQKVRDNTLRNYLRLLGCSLILAMMVLVGYGVIYIGAYTVNEIRIMFSPD